MIAGLEVPNSVLDNFEAAIASVEVDARDGQAVTLTFEIDGTGTEQSVTINGFEIGRVLANNRFRFLGYQEPLDA